MYANFLKCFFRKLINWEQKGIFNFSPDESCLSIPVLVSSLCMWYNVHVVINDQHSLSKLTIPVVCIC